MNRQIIIGKEGNQPFAILDPKVSRRHAYLNVDSSGNMQLIDNQSTNGTYIYTGSEFVRLYANQPYSVSPDSMIQLGPDTRFHVRRLLSSQNAGNAARSVSTHNPQRDTKEPQKPRRVDVSGLRVISDGYNTRKMELESKTGMINGLRSCTILVSMLAAGASGIISNRFNDSDNGQIISIALTVGIGALLIGVLLTIVNRYNSRLIRMRNENEHDYAVKYCCPECGLSFRGKIYENILSERRCPRCKSEYYEKSPKA